MKITEFTTGLRHMTAKTVTEGDYKIEDAELHDLNGKKHVVLLFSNDPRALRLTPQQVTDLSRRFGDETDDWKGHGVRLSRGNKGKGISLTIARA